MPIRLVIFDLADALPPGAVECIHEIRQRDIRIGTTADTTRAISDARLTAAKQHGFVPDVSFCADDVREGRPAPWMIFRMLEQLGIYPAKRAIRVCNSCECIREGLNAGVWTVGVVDDSQEFAELAEADREQRRAKVRDLFLEAGVDATIDGLHELLEAIEAFDSIAD